MTRLFSICFFFTISLSLTAQKFTKYPSTKEYKLMETVDQAVTADDFFSVYTEKMGLGQLDKMVLQQTTSGHNGYVHHKYTQEYNGVPVYGMAYILHSKDGQVKSANGSFASRLSLSTDPTLTAEEAIQIAILDMDADKYPWEVDHSRAGVIKERPQPQLCIIDKSLTRSTSIHKLVYRLDLFSAVPLDGQQYFIDAQNGEILHKVELFHTLGVPGQCETRYYGTQELIVDSISTNNYLLFDETRGLEGLGVIDFDNTFFSSETRNFDTDNDGYLKGAMDAHFCTTKMYDAMKEHFDWLGLDGQDASLKIGVFARGEEDFVNAFWNGETAWIGNGNCNVGPLATMEVVAHEFMHGIIDFTSELIYADESGAINESMADVVGHVMEFLEDEENFSWDLNSFVLNDNIEPFRVMDNPKVKEHPALYKGEFWVDGADVHTNSSIGNLLYVLLSDGRQGANEVGGTFDISGMGKLEAAQFIFHVNRNYLTPSSDYNAYYQASLIAAVEFFDGDQVAIDNLISAWAYLGLPTITSDDLNDLSIVSDGFYINCGFDTPVSTYFEITNVGSIDYTSDQNATVTVTEGFGVGDFLVEIALSEDILVGETLRVELDDLLMVEDQFTIINYILDYPADQEESNNQEDDIISTTEFTEDDISIALNPTVVGCFETEAEIEFRLINRSCEIIASGTELKVIVQNLNTSEILIDEDIVLDDFLFRNGSVTLTRTIQVTDPTIATLEAQVVYSGDPNPSNNIDVESFSAIETSDRDYFNGFNSAGEVVDGLGLDAVIDLADKTVNYNGESYFWATGVFEDSDEVLCIESEDNFKGDVDFFNGLSNKLTACVDLSNDDQPAVNFNLVQFRNGDIDFPSSLSSALEVRWGSEDNEAAYIMGQQEGELVRHQIPLPANYKGPLEFKFLTLTGNDNPQNLFNSDSQLLDNLHFGNAVSTENPVELQLKLIPNPAHSSLLVETTIKVSAIRIIDMNGRVVHRDTQPNLEISHLADGYYRLEVLSDQGAIFQESLIIVKQ